MKLDYDLLIAESAPPRREIINVGLVLWRASAPEIVTDASAQQRLAALNPNYPRLPVFKALFDSSLSELLRHRLCELTNHLDAVRMLLSILIAPMKAIPGGVLFAEDGDFEPHIERALDALVRRPALTVKAPRAKAQQSQLDAQLRTWFRGARIMGRGMDDLSKHRVVAQFPISVESDVYADFAYKNGALHVIETLDLRGADHVTSAMRNKAAFKSLTLDMARDVVSEGGRRLGVIAASDYGAIKSALRLFERNADDIFSIDSPNDTQRLAELLVRSLHLEGGLLSADRLSVADT